jgi:hypothetical protein
LLLLNGVFCVFCDRASAADPPDPLYPVTYSTPSPNEQFLFVMLAPQSDDPKKPADNTSYARELRTKYPASGLYRNDGSTTPLWTADWYAYAVYPADDGVHLVREDSPARATAGPIAKRPPEEKVQEQLDGPALSFLANGKVLKTYSVRELIAKPEDLPNSVTHVLWNAGLVLTRDGKRFVLMTQDAQQIIFDPETGNIISRKPAGLGNAKVWVMRGLMAFIALFFVAAFVRWLYFSRKGTGGP